LPSSAAGDDTDDDDDAAGDEDKSVGNEGAAPTAGVASGPGEGDADAQEDLELGDELREAMAAVGGGFDLDDAVRCLDPLSPFALLPTSKALPHLSFPTSLNSPPPRLPTWTKLVLYIQDAIAAYAAQATASAVAARIRAEGVIRISPLPPADLDGDDFALSEGALSFRGLCLASVEGTWPLF